MHASELQRNAVPRTIGNGRWGREWGGWKPGRRPGQGFAALVRERVGVAGVEGSDRAAGMEPMTANQQRPGR